MRLLLDVNVGSRMARALIDAGHDVVRAALTNTVAEDPAILDLAVADRRVLITHDRDFGELLFVRELPQPPGIVYLRFRARDVEAAIARLLPALDNTIIEGHMTVVDERRVRHTPLPARSRDND